MDCQTNYWMATLLLGILLGTVDALQRAYSPIYTGSIYHILCSHQERIADPAFQSIPTDQLQARVLALHKWSQWATLRIETLNREGDQSTFALEALRGSSFGLSASDQHAWHKDFTLRQLFGEIHRSNDIIIQKLIYWAYLLRENIVSHLYWTKVMERILRPRRRIYRFQKWKAAARAILQQPHIQFLLSNRQQDSPLLVNWYEHYYLQVSKGKREQDVSGQVQGILIAYYQVVDGVRIPLDFPRIILELCASAKYHTKEQDTLLHRPRILYNEKA